ncbi:hypothetical protein PHET_12434 [Paragonimus heterotremus]|uniref:Uncharacterized protein n=1 Tax=Paragonimus heterotremus TaxID=100268 RepID=A0A8J4T5J1_9TREM|nr:hypothetical protein PHET_12434 [Paragonimus heterotremus]
MENIVPQTGYNTVISFQQDNGNSFFSNVPSVIFMNLQHHNYQQHRITVRWMLNKSVILMRVAVWTKVVPYYICPTNVVISFVAI